jgi:hypothetical protein
LIEEGRANKEIAEALSIELPTVKNHVHSILQKLNVRRRSEAAARARRLGLWNSTLRGDLERTYGSEGSRFTRASRSPASRNGPIQGSELPRRH